MPFTPFHLGAGAALKAAGGDRFSFMVFGGTQALMDLEPGFMMLTGGTPLHGPSHTLGGALVVGAVAALIGALLDLVSISTLHQLCLIAGLVGGVGVWIRSRRRTQNQEQGHPSGIPGTGGTRE